MEKEPLSVGKYLDDEAVHSWNVKAEGTVLKILR
jgi:hypothetical protein